MITRLNTLRTQLGIMLPLVMVMVVMVTGARVYDSGDTARVDCGDAGRGAARLVRASFYKAGGRRIYS